MGLLKSNKSSMGVSSRLPFFLLSGAAGVTAASADMVVGKAKRSDGGEWRRVQKPRENANGKQGKKNWGCGVVCSSAGRTKDSTTIDPFRGWALLLGPQSILRSSQHRSLSSLGRGEESSWSIRKLTVLGRLGSTYLQVSLERDSTS